LSGTTRAGSPDVAWGVNFIFGSVDYDGKGSGYGVRAVRPGP